MKILNLGIVFAQCACLVSSQAITACYNNVGPHIFHQNATTGDLVYTLNVGTGNEDKFIPWETLTLPILPKKGTPLSATYYAGGDDQVGASLFYLSVSNSINQVQILCNKTSGKVVSQRGPWTLSAVVTTGVNSSTGLAASLRNTTDGDRCFYHDNDGTTQMLRYSAAERLDWGPTTSIMKATGQYANAIATDAGTNQTTYSIDSSGKIISATLEGNETWSATDGSPSDLPAWSPANVTIAATSSRDSSGRTLYYIGTDRALHQVVSSDRGKTWNVTASQPEDNWPLADQPNAPFGFASANLNGGASGLFYFSGGDLVLLSNDNDVWAQAKFVKLAPASTGGSSKKGTSNAVKIGAGVGVGLGIPILAAVVLFAILLRRRRKRAAAARQVSMYHHGGPHAYPYEKDSQDNVAHEVHGRSVAQEVSGAPKVVHELDNTVPVAKISNLNGI